mgnify:FL=1
MRIPLSWLREHAPLPEGATAEYVLETLVRVGFEEEAVHRPLDHITGPVVVGQVLSMEPETHSNGKTVNWCQVRVVPEGREQTLEGKGIEASGIQGIVCGAHNFSVGDKVVVTLPGAVLPGDFRISPRKTYGHVSAGMIASARELGLSDEHEGIIVLGELGLDPEPGQDALELLGLTDEAAEINVTPDRGYAFSVRGVAREYCLAVDAPFADPAGPLAERAPADNGEGYVVDLRDDAPIHDRPGCTRFVARTVRDLDPTRPTPPWLAARLRLAGIRSISLPVDISNYVMLELGQPLHFYDAEKIAGPLHVRRARPGETLQTLDGKNRELHPEDLIIADTDEAIGLAGVMGGAKTEVTGQTRHVLIEAAHFEEVSIARTRRRHRLPSEASKRFERGVDPQVAAAAAQRAVELLEELAGARAEDGVTDVGTAVEPRQITLPVGYAAARVGVDYTPEQIPEVLERIGCTVHRGGDVWQVAVPSWRPDLTAEEDLAEEIARVVGYEQIPSRLPAAPAGRGWTPEQAGRRRVLDAFAAAGLVEVAAYPFVSAEEDTLYCVPEAPAEGTVEHVRLANPISDAQGWLQRSLLPGLTEVLRRNRSRGFRDLALYQAATVFLPGQALGETPLPAGGTRPDAQVLEQLEAGLPVQPKHLAAVFCGHDAPEGPGITPRVHDWQDALDAARLAADVLGVALRVAQGRHQAFHPGRTARLEDAEGRLLGWAGELHPQVCRDRDLPERTCAMELDLTALLGGVGAPVQAGPVSPYPPVTQDVALIVDADLPAAQLLETLREGAGELLESARVFDEYRGESIGEDRKSVACALVFRAPDRTLTNEEAGREREAAVALAERRHGAVLRG